MPSTVISCTAMKDEVVDDVSTGRSNVSCSTVSVVRPCLSLNTQHHSSDLDLLLALVCTFLVFILTYLFFCFVSSLLNLRVIAKFAFELDSDGLMFMLHSMQREYIHWRGSVQSALLSLQLSLW